MARNITLEKLPSTQCMAAKRVKMYLECPPAPMANAKSLACGLHGKKYAKKVAGMVKTNK